MVYYLPFNLWKFIFSLSKTRTLSPKRASSFEARTLSGFDTETTALDPYEGEIRLVQLSNGKETQVIDLKPFYARGDLRTMLELAPLREILAASRPVKVAHNAKFDAKWVKHHLGVEIGGVFDTLIASQLIAAGDQDRRHNLGEVTSYFLGTELDKSEQVSDWSAPELSQSQIEYAARDAATMIPLREKVIEKLKSDDLVKVAKLEFDCIVPIASMELNGFYLDEARWREVLEKVKISQVKVADELQNLLSAGVAQASLFGRSEINLDSQTQVTDALKISAFLFPKRRAAGSCSRWQTIIRLSPNCSNTAASPNLCRASAKIFWNLSSRKPAESTPISVKSARRPEDSLLETEYPANPARRRISPLFSRADGKKLIIADYSQVELRILAEFSNDQNFIDAFVSGEDFHTTAAAQVFNVKPEEVTSDQRSFAKR
jgi:DNA polymerase I-like protein with 3'-5' exonuclease and polymerase domains